MACWRRRGRFDDYDEYHYLNHRRNQRHATYTGFFLFAAFLLFLFVALSLPIIKSIYLLQLNGITPSTEPKTSVATRLRFGVWGFCATRSGYTINPQTIAVVTDEEGLADLILKGLTASRCSRSSPVTASCCMYRKLPWIISLVLSVPTAITSTIVCAADLALIITARQRVKDHPTLNVSIDFGNGVWMVLVSALFTWIAMVLLAARVCRCCGFGR
ncbi:hypothetical protein EDB89DRAFT_2112071 [Lactarius sanguifluus]|nr:hypothetical protein EDB89DRAFT_2112071 [Lactarius sanguifluus]